MPSRTLRSPNKTQAVYLIVIFFFIRHSYCSAAVSPQGHAAPPRCLCSGPLPQSSPAARGSCPPCRPSCRSSAAEPRRRRYSWRTPQTWPGTARRSAPGITETLDSPSQESGDSLRARTCGGEIREKRGRGKGQVSQLNNCLNLKMADMITA